MGKSGGPKGRDSLEKYKTSKNRITDLGGNCRIRASILMAALVCDFGLGIWSIRFYDRPWPGLAVVLRMLAAAVLVGSLVGFLAAGRVFPADYTYWNLASSQSGGPVLGLVSAIL